MDIKDVKEKSKEIFSFLNRRKVLIAITVILFVLFVGMAADIRTNNISTLKDVTTGEYLTADLDAFYWLRIAEVLQENGSLPEYDAMRYPSLHLPFSNELLPAVLVLMHKTASIFSTSITLQYIDVIYPVIFFILSMIVFFFLILKLTHSKLIALLSSFFLSIIPAYLFRTMAGVSDHEPLGMFAFFLVLLMFTFSMERIGKNVSWKEVALLGVGTGFLTVFNIAAWSGVSAFTLLIIPLSVFLLWITNNKNNKKRFENYLIFYLLWIISFILLGFVFDYPINNIIGLLLSFVGLITPLFLVFFVIDYILIKFGNFKLDKLGKYRIILSFAIAGILLFLGSLIFGQNIGFSLSNLISNIIRPFGGGRTGQQYKKMHFHTQ